MQKFDGCQIPCLPKIAEGKADLAPQSFINRFKQTFAQPWNHYVRKWLRRLFTIIQNSYNKITKQDKFMAEEKSLSSVHLQAGDWVRVRSFEEIQQTLNPFKELKGCAFLEDMKQYCGTKQRVFKILERFLDERDYQVKKARGIVLLEHIFCQGTPVFGRCDRSCLLFWREEWLEKITE